MPPGKSRSYPLRIYAHRGANRSFPENTLPAFRHALRQQATHLEMDVQRTQDAHIVVTHDPDGKRIAGVSRNIVECSLKEVQSWDLSAHARLSTPIPSAEQKNCYIPTFEEVLEQFPGVPLNVDIKDSRLETITQTVDLLHYRGDFKRVLLTSFDSRILHSIRHRAGYLGQTGISRREAIRLLFLPPLARRWFPILGTALQIPPVWNKIRLDRAAVIARCHSILARVDYWTIDDPAEARRLLELGADGLITDDVDAIRDVVFDFARQSKRNIAGE